MFFRIYGCLIAHGKCIFRKCISVILCWECKLISVSILPSNTIFWKTERERAEWEGERKKSHAQRERGRERERTILRRRAVDLAFVPLRRRSRSREAPRRSRSTAPRRSRSTAPRLRASLSSFFSQFDRIWWFFLWVLSVFLYWGMNDIVIFVWQPRKCEKMWTTSRKCVFYGIFKNITKHQKIFFEKIFEMQPNTWKHFPFRKIFYFPDLLLHEPNTAWVTKRLCSWLVWT